MSLFYCLYIPTLFLYLSFSPLLLFLPKSLWEVRLSLPLPVCQVDSTPRGFWDVKEEGGVGVGGDGQFKGGGVFEF